MKSTFLNINTNDFLKGLLVAVLSSTLSIVYSTINAGSLNIDWKVISTTALTSGLGYIFKNLLTNSNGQILKKEN
jgi:hypothetical protein